MDNLPLELLLAVFGLLDTPSLLQARAVEQSLPGVATQRARFARLVWILERQFADEHQQRRRDAIKLRLSMLRLAELGYVGVVTAAGTLLAPLLVDGAVGWPARTALVPLVLWLQAMVPHIGVSSIESAGWVWILLWGAGALAALCCLADGVLPDIVPHLLGLALLPLAMVWLTTAGGLAWRGLTARAAAVADRCEYLVLAALSTLPLASLAAWFQGTATDDASPWSRQAPLLVAIAGSLLPRFSIRWLGSSIEGESPLFLRIHSVGLPFSREVMARLHATLADIEVVAVGAGWYVVSGTAVAATTSSFFWVMTVPYIILATIVPSLAAVEIRRHKWLYRGILRGILPSRMASLGARHKYLLCQPPLRDFSGESLVLK
ncbi:uncharacterized protein AMSG_03014 [Thecamonas trahens ATCC 50062]|uniref:F-box domain-containing protein n=1 Tax=Thecamonas trahens ATCC 50062 TaxID=461836 RepID=A0A0L0D2Q5_THETB|nr:hypothetical protein AMSG_03014 [Thecamonas trahens ATCC 50062]KNC46579.1 hypothetical protein AMSG_03014 [Thecamonas trahens ATCC 50062]|eukprot:XP_013760356.1 hypothetical protein AMSG_03014 [Thecamonas trahens ATCC 50062]